jgi:hypothetical protein
MWQNTTRYGASRKSGRRIWLVAVRRCRASRMVRGPRTSCLSKVMHVSPVPHEEVCRRCQSCNRWMVTSRMSASFQTTNEVRVPSDRGAERLPRARPPVRLTRGARDGTHPAGRARRQPRQPHAQDIRTLRDEAVRVAGHRTPAAVGRLRFDPSRRETVHRPDCLEAVGLARHQHERPAHGPGTLRHEGIHAATEIPVPATRQVVSVPKN